MAAAQEISADAAGATILSEHADSFTLKNGLFSPDNIVRALLPSGFGRSSVKHPVA